MDIVSERDDLKKQLKICEDKLEDRQSMIDDLKTQNKDIKYSLSKTEKEIEEKEQNLETT